MPLSMQQVQRQTQRLIMTPQMQQSIQLLQMNSMDLEMLVRNEMMENPFLEISDDEEALQSDNSDSGIDTDIEIPAVESGLSEKEAEKARELEILSGDSDEPDYRPPTSSEGESGNDTATAEAEEGNFESTNESDVDWDDQYSDSDTIPQASVAEDSEENDFTEYTALSEGLHDSLRRQVALSALSGRELEIGEFLIGNVNDDGYIEAGLDNQAMMVGYPVEFIRPDRAGKPDFVERRLRRALAKMYGGVDPEAYATMKRKELVLRCFSHILAQPYEKVSVLPRPILLKRLIAKRLGRDLESFDDMPEEELLLEVVAHRLRSTPEIVFDVIEVLQDFEPTGVCARNLAECLRLQCEEKDIRDRLVYRILDGYLDLLLQKKFRDISRTLGCTEEEAGDVFTTLSRLEPRPGRSNTRETPRYIVPDVFVKKVDGKYLYYLNEGDTGRLTVATTYKRMMKPSEGAKESKNGTAPEMVEVDTPTTNQPVIDKEFAHNKYRSAIWLIKNIEKRKTTILRVTEAIMEYQRAFLEKGIEHLRPLTLRDIAEVVGMHESTIARVTANKYVETPRGVYVLKYFFNSGLETDEGEMAASRAIKEMITQLIGAESPKRPLSDQKIADKLRDKGIQIARRTVAKYREQLKILPARLRKQVN